MRPDEKLSAASDFLIGLKFFCLKTFKMSTNWAKRKKNYGAKNIGMLTPPLDISTF